MKGKTHLVPGGYPAGAGAQIIAFLARPAFKAKFAAAGLDNTQP